MSKLPRRFDNNKILGNSRDLAHGLFPGQLHGQIGQTNAAENVIISHLKFVGDLLGKRQNLYDVLKGVDIIVRSKTYFLRTTQQCR